MSLASKKPPDSVSILLPTITHILVVKILTIDYESYSGVQNHDYLHDEDR